MSKNKEKETFSTKVQEGEENVEYTSLSIDGFEYLTTLNTKYKNRKRYQEANPRLITAFISGTIDDVYVKKGKSVKAGDELLILEAMKMKNVIQAPLDAKIKNILVKKGDRVSKNQLLIELE